MNIVRRTRESPAMRVRAALPHPVIDGDGHMIEVEPILRDFLHQVAGPDMVGRFETATRGGALSPWYAASEAERRSRRLLRAPFWFLPAATADRATAMLPGLYAERLGEFGIDLAILYPTVGLLIRGMADDELRLAIIRALNTMNAEVYRDHGRRLIPAAAIPMRTPREALDEIDHCFGRLGFKVAMIDGAVRRPVPALAERHPELGPRGVYYWVDNLGLDSAHDYDPVWRRLCELGVAATVHMGSMGWGSRTSISSYVYNHIGHFAEGNETMCKGLVLGGVLHRFPDLRFGFLEGGVGWAVTLYNDLIEHWEKRNRDSIRRLDPATVDRSRLVELFRTHGDDRQRAKADLMRAGDGSLIDQRPERVEEIDEWAGSGIAAASDIRALLVERCFFGCEAEDRMVGAALNPKFNKFGARLKAMLGSDIGHWDVDDPTRVLAEAHELVENGLISSEDFADYTFRHAVELHGGQNRRFFEGTAVAAAARAVLGAAASGNNVGRHP
jgi:predicted TIM-barrel fold metal-dependent hydrolase